MNDSHLRLEYASQSMQYTTQFLASISDTEVILDCGSVVLAADQTGDRHLPIHTRMALPWPAVIRLHQLLGEMIDSRKSSLQVDDPQPRASLPPLSQDATSPDGPPPSSRQTST